MNKIPQLKILTYVFIILLEYATVTLQQDDCNKEVIPGKIMYIIRNYETGNCLSTTTKNISETLSMTICDLNNANLHFYFFDKNKIRHYKSELCVTATTSKPGTEIAPPEVLLSPCDTNGTDLSAYQTWFEHNRYNSFTAMWTTWKADSSELRLTTNISYPYTPFLSNYDYWDGKQLWKFEGVPSCQNMSPGSIP